MPILLKTHPQFIRYSSSHKFIEMHFSPVLFIHSKEIETINVENITHISLINFHINKLFSYTNSGSTENIIYEETNVICLRFNRDSCLLILNL